MPSFLNSFLDYLPSLTQPNARNEAAAAGQTAKLALDQLLAELPELLVAAVVTIDSGRVLASYTGTALRLNAAAAAWAAMARQLQHAQLQQGQPQEQLEEVLTSVGAYLHLLRMCPGGQHFTYVVVDLHDTNLALVRELITRIMPALASLG